MLKLVYQAVKCKKKFKDTTVIIRNHYSKKGIQYKRKGTTGQTTICKTLHRKLYIEQYEPHENPEVNSLCINSQPNKIPVPKLYYYGPRKLNIILKQLRCRASFLNHDLCKVNISSSPACSLGAPQEDTNHFFFVCTKYSDIRNNLFLSISNLSQLINTSLLTSGSETLSYADNCFYFWFRF